VSGIVDALSHARAPRRRVLLLVYHRDGVETAALTAGPGLIVGRQAPADVIVRDVSLSRRHARFSLVEGEVFVEDLGSLNGLQVGGRRVLRSAVNEGEAVLLGGVTAAIHVLAGAEAPPAGLESHEAFRTAVETETVRARFFGRSFAVVTVRSPIQKEGHVRHWCLGVRELLRPVDRVALYSSDTVEILLPEVAGEKAEEMASAIATPRPGGPPLVCGVASFPQAATTAEKLLEVSREAAMRATRAEPVRLAVELGSRTVVAAGAAVFNEGDERLMTRSPAMRAVVETAKRVARSSIPVLLSGETGTGKEVLSRFIHETGPRGRKPMICVNCGSIPAQLVESTLFGHERGAFTHAVQQQKGVFEAADGGTVLLDEIGELPAAAQTALLRVLESKRITRVGATREIEVDVRVIAATHRDLEAMTDAGTFRLDLLYRLNAMTLKIPPLRERREDIEPLCQRFLVELNRTNGRDIRAVAPQTLALLERYSWPGNIRELRNAIERAVVIAEGDTITPADLPERARGGGAVGSPGQEDAPSIDESVSAAERPANAVNATAAERPANAVNATAAERPANAANVTAAERPANVASVTGAERPANAANTSPAAMPAAERGSMKLQMERAEREAILDALRKSNGSQTEAARLLDMPLRTFQHKIKGYGIKKLGYGASDT